MNSVGRGPLGLNRFGREKNWTEPNRTEINPFEPVFGSIQKIKKNRFGCLFWFKTGPNQKCSALAEIDPIWVLPQVPIEVKKI
jgi:hypothetical protein